MSQQAVTSSTEDIISADIDTLRSQIQLLQKRTAGDDLSKRLFESTLATADNLVNDINQLLDAGASDYNALVDQFEEFQRVVNASLISFSHATGMSATAETLGEIITEYAEQHKREIGTLEASLQQANTLRAAAESDLRRYKKDFPSSLAKRLDDSERDNRSLKRERRELKERVSELNKVSIKYQGENVSLRKKLASAQAIIEKLK